MNKKSASSIIYEYCAKTGNKLEYKDKENEGCLLNIETFSTFSYIPTQEEINIESEIQKEFYKHLVELNNFTINIPQIRKKITFQHFYDIYKDKIEEYYHNEEKIEKVDYIEWGCKHYNVNYRLNKEEDFNMLCNESILFIDTEGSPNIQMVQIGRMNDNIVYIFNITRFLQRYINQIMTSETIKKVLWSAKEEITRGCKNNVNVANWIDCQERYKGLSLKRVIGNKYKIKCIVDKKVYQQSWKKPTQLMCQYAAIDIYVLKECYVDTL